MLPVPKPVGARSAARYGPTHPWSMSEAGTRRVTVSVAITNDPSAVAGVVTTAAVVPPPPTDGRVAPTMSDTLLPTGGSPGQPLIIALAVLALGSVAVVYATRRRAASSTER
jgi:hypothetical protein